MRVVGRLAFPLFCLTIATNVVRQPVRYPDGCKYLGGILLFAMLSQWLYSRYFDNGYLNILFVLALGLLIAQAVHHRTPRLVASGFLAHRVPLSIQLWRGWSAAACCTYNGAPSTRAEYKNRELVPIRPTRHDRKYWRLDFAVA